MDLEPKRFRPTISTGQTAKTGTRKIQKIDQEISRAFFLHAASDSCGLFVFAAVLASSHLPKP
jgi:hypothetical protein